MIYGRCINKKFTSDIDMMNKLDNDENSLEKMNKYYPPPMISGSNNLIIIVKQYFTSLFEYGDINKLFLGKPV